MNYNKIHSSLGCGALLLQIFSDSPIISPSYWRIFCLTHQPELISEQGYPVEIHHVETPDGYILEMHRIPYGKRGNASSTKDRPTVYLQHCFLCSSSDWIMNTPDNALG